MNAVSRSRPCPGSLPGLPLLVTALLALCAARARADLDIYMDSLQAGWNNWSWAAVNLANPSPVQSGARSISVTASNWQALYLNAAPALDAAAFTNLTFWLHGGPAGGQSLQVQALLSGAPQRAVVLPNLTAGLWQEFTVPLLSLGLSNQLNFDGFWIQVRTASSVPVFYVDSIKLIAAATNPPPATNAPMTVAVDALADRRPIPPLIYGVCWASSNQLKELNVPLNRWGGNSTTRYNWATNADNRAADWYFQSIAYSSSVPGNEANKFITDTRNGGAQPMLTVPVIGWVAKIGAGRSKLCSYSIAKYGPQTGNDAQWYPDAGNGISVTNNTRITWNDPHDANLPAGTNFMAGWIKALTNRWGAAAAGGLRYYLLDNEWGLWHETHRDVHPVGATMDQCRDKSLDMARLIKAIDPDAWVVGPEEWGWLGYLYSGYDKQNPGYTDRAAHGGKDFLPWWLDQFRQHSEAAGRRLLDLFTVHYYPQGGDFGSDVSTAMQLLRNRCTRSLWDTNYTDPSWINQRIYLIPRLKQWAAANYPGTPIGITEYDFGAETHINGATAQADVLGIFGREGLDVATKWVVPATGTPVYRAFQMYRNYDGNKSTFGQLHARATVPSPDQLAAFAAVRTNDGALTIMVVNKALTGWTPVRCNLTNFPAQAAAQVWQLTSANSIARLADLPLTGSLLSNTVPAQSITLFIVPPRPQARLTAEAPPAPGQHALWLEGTLGTTWVLEASPNLTAWQAVSTNWLGATPLRLIVPHAGSAPAFYRALAR